jgi:hypothetical protein
MLPTSLAGLLLWPVLAFAATIPTPVWRKLDKGLEFARWVVPSYDSTKGTGYCRMGSNCIAALRIDPNRYRFETFHYSAWGRHSERSEESDRRETLHSVVAGPPFVQGDTVGVQADRVGPDLLTIETWRETTHALVVFNAGQYHPDLTYMGLLVNRDRRFGKKLHPQWQALFVAEPNQKGLRKARILDLKYNRFSPDSTPYTQIAQSFMLFDWTGRKRVKQGDWIANRTVVAEDGQERILVFVSEGGYTLWDFAQLLQSSRLKLVKGMSMDGGYEAELCVKVKDFSYVTYGQWETSDYGDLSLPGIQMAIPAVIGVFRRDS